MKFYGILWIVSNLKLDSFRVFSKDDEGCIPAEEMKFVLSQVIMMMTMIMMRIVMLIWFLVMMMLLIILMMNW